LTASRLFKPCLQEFPSKAHGMKSTMDLIPELKRFKSGFICIKLILLEGVFRLLFFVEKARAIGIEIFSVKKQKACRYNFRISYLLR
jgi:hypothetical protein